MKIGIISDIHSNSEALNCVLQDVGKVDEFICLGDIVGYGAEPDYCIDRIKKLNCKCIGGNHDFGVIRKVNLNYFNFAAKVAILWTTQQLSKESFNFLSNLDKGIALTNSIFAVHGSPQDPIMDYIIDEYSASLIFRKYKFKIYFIGHSHLAGYFSLDENNNQISYTNFNKGGCIEIKQNKRYIINCGSVGQPRDGNPQTSYGIYDTVLKNVTINRISYPVHLTQEKIINAGLPKILADRLIVGK